MQHVRECLRVHQSVFNGHFQHGNQVGMAFFRPRQSVFDGSVQLVPQPTVVALHFFTRRPILWPVVGQSPTHGVDSKRKKVIE